MKDVVDPVAWLPVAEAVRLGSVALALAFASRLRTSRLIAIVGSCIASLLAGGLAVAVLLDGQVRSGTLLAHRASGFTLGFRVDPLSAWFLLVLSTLAVPIAVYGIGYLAHVEGFRSTFVASGLSLVMGSVELVFSADGVVGFLFAWELMTLVATAVVATEHEKAETRKAALLYLVMSHVATGCLIGAFFIVSRATGALSFEGILAAPAIGGSLRTLAFILFFIGFGVKAGVVPLHIWLPEAHPAAPSNFSAFMSAVLIKTGIYGLFRMCVFGLGVPPPSFGVIILVAGGVSAVLGVLYALMQHDIKRLLAYHSIENVGIILLGLGAGMMALASGHGGLAALGFAASLFHILNHAIFKGLLFLGAGGVVMATGTRNIEEMGGLARRMPWTSGFFLVGAAAISGLPLLNGFASEWLLFQALLFGFHVSPELFVRFLFPVAGALLALTSALAAACFVKAFGITFLALPRGKGAEDARELPLVMLIAQALLAALCIAIGLVPGSVVRVLQTVTTTIPGVRRVPEMVDGAFSVAAGPAGAFDHVTPVVVAAAVLLAAGLAAFLGMRAWHRVRRAPTWGCGGELTAGTEYTATAFSKPLMMIFSAIYRPTREVSQVASVSPYFPSEVRYRAHIEPTFERFVYGPLTRFVLGIADRMKVIQAGSLLAYLAYVIALVVVLVVMLWWRI